MKVLYYHQYFTTPAGCDGSRSYAFAQSLVREGHQVQMVCLRYERSCTGLDGPFINGKRMGRVDGIDVVEFDISLSNHANFLRRSVAFFALVGEVCSCQSARKRIWFSLQPRLLSEFQV